MPSSFRVVVPPHPLVAHWLTVLRDQQTPSPLFATAMKELGRWLTYEASRDWLPQRTITVETPLASCEGQVGPHHASTRDPNPEGWSGALGGRPRRAAPRASRPHGRGA